MGGMHPLPVQACRFRTFDSENLFDLLASFFATKRVVERFAALEADKVGHKADLRGRPVAMSPVNLPIDVPCIDKQHRICPVRYIPFPVALCENASG